MASTTPEAKIAAALKAHLDALTLSPVLTIAWPGKAVTPPADAYLRVDNMRNRTDRLTVGNDGPHRQQGIFSVTVMAPINQGEAALETGGLIADHFGVGTLLPFDGGSVRIDKRPDVESLRNPDGTRWMIPVSVAWIAFV